MFLASSTRYALRSLIELAENYENGYLTLDTIRKGQNISEKYLENIFRGFKKNNLVIGKRNIGGGYMLSKNPGQITVSNVLIVGDGNLNIMPCR